MRSTIFFLVTTLTFCFYVPVARSDAGGRFKIALATNLTPSDNQVDRHGFDVGAGIYRTGAIKRFIMSSDIFINGTFAEDHLFRFGIRNDIGVYRFINKLKYSHIMVSLGLLQMAVSSSRKVMWNPGVGLDLTGHLFFARMAFQGYVGEIMGYGVGVIAGLSLRSIFR